MDHLHLGRTGLKVSRFCLGTMNFGQHADEPTSWAIMDRALELGLNFFDTANVYGGVRGEGITEQIIGRWLAQGGGRRERIVLATKVYGIMGDGPNDRRLSAHHIMRACEGSLKRLGVGTIDLYQMHHVDRLTPWAEIWQAMDILVQQGKVRYVGSSNFAGWHIVQGQEAAVRRGSLGLVSEQSKYHLACRHVELEVLPACGAYGLGVIPWSPLAGGMLGGALAKAAEGRRATEGQQNEIARHRPQLERWEALCTRLGQPPADVALSWLLHQPAVTAPIIGPRTVRQLDDCQRALEIALDAETLGEIDGIWPGPGGQAPEAYAW